MTSARRQNNFLEKDNKNLWHCLFVRLLLTYVYYVHYLILQMQYFLNTSGIIFPYLKIVMSDCLEIHFISSVCAKKAIKEF